MKCEFAQHSEFQPKWQRQTLQNLLVENEISKRNFASEKVGFEIPRVEVNKVVS